MADGVLKVFYPQIFGHSHQLQPNKLFDSSTPYLRNVDDSGKGKIKWGGEKDDNNGDVGN